jgi:hypothetical protein
MQEYVARSSLAIMEACTKVNRNTLGLHLDEYVAMRIEDLLACTRKACLLRLEADRTFIDLQYLSGGRAAFFSKLLESSGLAMTFTTEGNGNTPAR